MFPKVNSDLSFQCATLGTPSVLTLSFDYPRTQRSPLPARLGEAKVAWMRAGGLWWFFHLLMFTCQVKQPQLYPWRRSSSYPLLAVKLEKHACTRQPHYMLFGCLMRAGWKMENVPSVVCLMAGFLSSNHTAGVPGWSRQHPSAGHCREKKHSFSTRIIIISLSAPRRSPSRTTPPLSGWRAATATAVRAIGITGRSCTRLANGWMPTPD